MEAIDHHIVWYRCDKCELVRIIKVPSYVMAEAVNFLVPCKGVECEGVSRFQKTIPEGES